MRLGLVLALIAIGASARAETVVIDFTTSPQPSHHQVSDAALTALLRRFPHPHAKGKPCSPNRSPEDRMGGELLPYITSVDGAITREAKQTAYVIDYCPTGNGVPRTRRLLVLEGTAVVLDRELPTAIPADAILAAPDLDGDGRAELVLTSTEHARRAVLVVHLVRVDNTELTLLGSWPGLEHCSVTTPPDEIAHRITATGRRGPFKDTAIARRCYYPPARPGSRRP